LISFHNKLYVAEDLLKDKAKVIKKMKKGKLQMGVFVITLPVSQSDTLEIYPSYVLLQKVYKKLELTVVGLAGGQDTAFGLVEKMMNDCLKANENADIRGFFEE